MAVTSYMKTFQDLDMVQLAVLPMFLFSGTFYGLDVYPAWLRSIVECLPLNHGIELLRELNAGVIDWSMLGHVAYFVVMAGVGVVVTARRLETSCCCADAAARCGRGDPAAARSIGLDHRVVAPVTGSAGGRCAASSSSPGSASRS